MEKAGFDPSVNVRFRHEMKGGLRFPATGTEISNPNFTFVKAARAAGVCPLAVRKWVAVIVKTSPRELDPAKQEVFIKRRKALSTPAAFWVLKAQR